MRLLLRSIQVSTHCHHIHKFLSTTTKAAASAPPLSYKSVSGQEPLLGLTIGQLVDSAADRFGDQEGIFSAHQNIRRSFHAIKKQSDELAEGFLRLGLAKGDRVGLWGPNSYEWYLTHMAVAKAGLVLVNLNPAYQGRELLYSINRVGIKCMVMASSFKTQNYYNILASVVPNVTKADPGKVKCDQAPSLTTVVSMDSAPLQKKEHTNLKGVKYTRSGLPIQEVHVC